jgi:mannose-6-phosphate isomerase
VIHALGAGVVIFELQQSSDLTYRLYDWDRRSVGGIARELHLDKGSDVADRLSIVRHLIEPLTLEEGPYRRRLLGACRYFAAELWDVPGGATLALPDGRLQALTVLSGMARVHAESPDCPACDLSVGQSCLIPVSARTCQLEIAADDCRFIRSYLPDLAADVVEPLRRRGVSDELIAQLGGDGHRSDLWANLGRL